MLPTLLALLAPVDLRRTPKVDERTVYAMQAVIESANDDGAKYTGTLTERVKSVSGDTVTTTVESRTRVELMGIVREGRSIQTERVERLDGTLVTPPTVDSTVLFATARVDRLRGFYPPSGPVEVGATWWRTEGPNATLKAPAFASYLKFVGEETVGSRTAWKVSLDAAEVDDERPARVKGMLWLDKGNLSLVRGQWTIDGYSYGETAATGQARLELSRTDASNSTR